MPHMTERQGDAWPEAVSRARDAGATGITEDGYHWSYAWQDEVRPGRGHHLDARWTDGEHFVQITMDVYGYPSVSVAELSWLHSDSDEECTCPLCEERNHLEAQDEVSRGSE